MADDFDLWELIAAPIGALNEAEAGAASRFVELLLDYALEPPEPAAPATSVAASLPPASSKLREVSFDTRRINTLGQMETRRLTLPLLQLMPIGGVSIGEATLTYGFSMRAVRGTNPAGRAVSGQPATTAAVPRFQGRLAQTTGGSTGATSSTTDANISIAVTLKQMDLPGGVLTLLQQTQGGVDDSRVLAPATQPQLPNPPPQGSAPLFTAELLDASGRVVKPGEKFAVRMAVAPRQGLTQPLRLSVSSQPADALVVVEHPATYDLSSPVNIDVVMYVNSAVRDFKPGVPVSIVLHGMSYDEHGSPVELITLLDLPRA